MKYLYKYPQTTFPYDDLVNTNCKRTWDEFEYELMDTGVFDEDRYFDLVVEYAKAGPEDLLIQITAHNRGSLLLFTENDTNQERIFGKPNASPYLKDGIHNAIIHGQTGAVNSEKTGTKFSAHYAFQLDPGQSQVIRLRLSDTGFGKGKSPFGRSFDQQLAGMMWGKQYNFFDLDHWLQEHGDHPLSIGKRLTVRNRNWFHMVNDDIISMPDKWEYPWYAAWDLAFNTLTLGMIDPEFAKQQLDLMLRELYLHPSGQIPAYEWNFGDVNPPVHAWETY